MAGFFWALFVQVNLLKGNGLSGGRQGLAQGDIVMRYPLDGHSPLLVDGQYVVLYGACITILKSQRNRTVRFVFYGPGIIEQAIIRAIDIQHGLVAIDWAYRDHPAVAGIAEVGRCYQRSVVAIGCEHSMKADQMSSWPGHQGSQPAF